MNCKNLQDWLHEYVDGSLDARERTAADRHLAECSACRQAVHRERHFARIISNRLRHDAESLTLRPEIRSRILKAADSRSGAPGMLEVIAGWWAGYARQMAVPFFVMLIGVGLLPAYFHFHQARVYHTETIASITRESRPAVAIQVSYQVPAYTFHREGNFVTDSVSDKTVVADVMLRPGGVASLRQQPERKTSL